MERTFCRQRKTACITDVGQDFDKDEEKRNQERSTLEEIHE